MSTISQNDEKVRITKQVRLGINNHKRLKFLATEKGKTISSMADLILDEYFAQKAKENQQKNQNVDNIT